MDIKVKKLLMHSIYLIIGNSLHSSWQMLMEICKLTKLNKKKNKKLSKKLNKNPVFLKNQKNNRLLKEKQFKEKQFLRSKK